MITTDLQLALKARGFYKGAIDGIAGHGTRAAIKGFQRSVGLAPDGIPGPATRAALGPILAPSLAKAEAIDAQDERVIAKLHETLHGPARRLLVTAFEEGLDLTVTQGLRTHEEQARLYAQGRTTPGNIVTWAQPGSSWHNFGLALDVALDGDPGPRIRPQWPNDRKLWTRVGEIGEALGFEWGGRWERVDLPHFQMRGGLTMSQARMGQRPA